MCEKLPTVHQYNIIRIISVEDKKKKEKSIRLNPVLGRPGTMIFISFDILLYYIKAIFPTRSQCLGALPEASEVPNRETRALSRVIRFARTCIHSSSYTLYKMSRTKHLDIRLVLLSVASYWKSII